MRIILFLAVLLPLGLIGCTVDAAQSPEGPKVAGAAESAPQDAYGFKITSPAPGTVFAPGDRIDVTVEPTGGATLDRVLVDYEFGAELIKGAPFTAQLPVPDKAIGTMTLQALAFDENNNLLATPDVVFVVEPLDTLVSLRVFPDPARLPAFAPSKHLTVTGTYDSGVQRDLTDSKLGTIYTTTGSAAAVDTNGLVTARHVGSTVVVASNGGIEGSASVYIESRGPYLFKPIPTESGTSEFAATGTTAGSDVLLYWGAERGTTPIEFCPDSPVDIASARLLASTHAQGGEDSLSAPVVEEPAGKSRFFQIIETGTCRSSEVLVFPFGNDPS